jgi:hypothetical protein
MRLSCKRIKRENARAMLRQLVAALGDAARMCDPAHVVHIATSQAQKEVTANAAFDALDLAMTDMLTIGLTSGTELPMVLAGAQALRCAATRFTGTAPCGVVVRVLAVTKGYIVINNSSGVVTVGVAGGGSATVAAGATALVYCTGTAVVVIGG